MSLTPIKTKKVIRAIVRRKKQVDHFMIITKYHLAQKKQFILLVEKKNIFHHKFSQTLFFFILFIYFFFVPYKHYTSLSVSYFSPTKKFSEMNHIVLFMSLKFMDLENTRKKFTLRIYMYVYCDGSIT